MSKFVEARFTKSCLIEHSFGELMKLLYTSEILTLSNIDSVTCCTLRLVHLYS